jgi:uncharacterized surface anchored protein
MRPVTQRYKALAGAHLRAAAIVCTALFLTFVAAVQTAHAQDITGLLSGTVTDKQGAVIVGASVIITNEATGVSRPPITTDASGHWITDALPVGSYMVFVTAQGFKTTTVPGQFVTVGGHLNVDVAMEIWTAPKIVYAGPITNRVTVGWLSGTVKDMQGGILMGASVVVTNEDNGVSRPPITTDSSGHWVADDLPVGTYTVNVAATGYKTAIMSGTSVKVGGRVIVDMVLDFADPDNAACGCIPAAPCPCKAGRSHYEPLSTLIISHGRIIGIVTDSNGSPIAKAKVTITNKATGVKRSTITDQKGVYIFEGIQPGSAYAVTIKAKKFHTVTATVNIAAGGGNGTVDFVMHR